MIASPPFRRRETFIVDVPALARERRGDRHDARLVLRDEHQRRR
jgi:hypothetical protein